MSLKQHITIKANYTRSINVERHSSSIDNIKAYLPTSRSISTLERVAETFVEQDTPRAWSLVGPYGSGKSAFAVYLTALLSAPSSEISLTATSSLANESQTLASKYQAETAGSSGYLPVLISGSSEPLAQRIIQALINTARELWSTQKGKKPAIFESLNRALESKISTASEIVKLILELQNALANLPTNQPKGILLVIDELGKFLEYESRHEGSTDIFILQSLAEHAAQHHTTRLLLLVMLHKSFENYAKGLTEQAKNQWAAVQGRFEEIPFIENTEQVLKVVGLAIHHSKSVTESTSLKKRLSKIAYCFFTEKALPQDLSENHALEVFENCYPLHPASAMLLPALCQKVAQNERTLFSYLGSSELFGFKNMLEQLEHIGDFVYPHHIYDYFISNQSAVLGDFQVQRRWVEAVSALERLGDAPRNTVELLKTIGILNILGARGGFKPSRDILQTCFASDDEFQESLNHLTSQSIITYRRFNNEYRVWQGSDFDLNEALQEELEKLPDFSLAEELSATSPLNPIVARRYLIQNGTMRYFTPCFADHTNINRVISKKNKAEPRVIFYLAESNSDKHRFEVELKNKFHPLDIVTQADSAALLYALTKEIKALIKIQARAEINNDPIATKELKENILATTQKQKELLNDLLYNPQDSNWYRSGKRLSVTSRRDVQIRLSEALEEVFSETPKVFNELINREKPSSQAASGRNKLMKAMVFHSEKADLGIEKYPPEKAIYRSVLKELDLHQPEKNSHNWCIEAPTKGSYQSTWNKISEFLDGTEKKAKSFVDLNDVLSNPPFGIKSGLLPVFYLHAYLVYKEDIALYEEGKYQAHMTEEHVERFVKRPDLFTFQLYRIEGINSSLMKAYNHALFDEKTYAYKAKIVALAQPLVKFSEELPKFTRSTRTALLTKQSKQVRDAFNMAKSPEKLMFTDLPKALGAFDEDNQEEVNTHNFSDKLRASLKELKYCYSNMLKEQQDNIAKLLHSDEEEDLSIIRQQITTRYKPLLTYAQGAGNTPGFIQYLIDKKLNDEAWLENILMYLTKVHPKNWRDQEIAIAEAKLADFSRKLREIESLNYETQDHNNHKGDFDVILLRSITRSSGPKERRITISHSQSKEIKEQLNKLEIFLSKIDNEETRLAVIASLVDKSLS